MEDQVYALPEDILSSSPSVSSHLSSSSSSSSLDK
jgi:hypothetical protein